MKADSRVRGARALAEGASATRGVASVYAFLPLDGFRPELAGVKENFIAPSELSSVDIHS